MPEVTARIEIPTRTILKLLLVLATLWFLARIGPVLQQLFAGLLIALALYPPVARLQRRGMAKGPSIATVFGGLLAVLVLLLWFLVPHMVDEGQDFVENADEYVEEGASWLDDNVPWLYDRLLAAAEDWSGTDDIDLEEGLDQTGAGDGAPVDPEAAINVGQGVGGFVATSLVATVLAIYFLTDGERAFRWLARDLSPTTVRRIRRAAPALSELIGSYVVNQVRMSALCGLYTFAVLSALNVPSALILATIAAFTDAIPLIGVVMATLPAVVVALTQGWETALLVLLAFVAYQAFENWILIPRLFGRALNLSSFAMLMAVLIGWKLAGLVGVLLALPTAAALLVIERVWQDEDPDAELPEASQPGPVALAAAVVATAADLAGDDAQAGDAEAGDAAEPDPSERERPGTQRAHPAPTAEVAPSPAAGRSGGRRRQAKRAAPGTTPS